MSVLPLSVHAVDLIVALMALECLAILLWRSVFRSGPAPFPFIANILAGAFLMLALRSALTGSPETAAAICLLAALVAHLVDLRLRWDGPGPI